jgi:hypothetical protein
MFNLIVELPKYYIVGLKIMSSGKVIKMLRLLCSLYFSLKTILKIACISP